MNDLSPQWNPENYDDPEAWVRANRDDLVDVIKHGSDPFARAGAWAALIRFGSEPDFDELERELRYAREVSA